MELLYPAYQATGGPPGAGEKWPAAESGVLGLQWTWQLDAGGQVRADSAPVTLQPLCP